MAINEHTSTRRALIAGLAALPAIGAAGQLSAATKNPDWSRLLREWREAHDAMERAMVPFNAAEARYSRAIPPEPEAPAAPKLWNADGTENLEALRSVTRGSYRKEREAYEQRRIERLEVCETLRQRIVGSTEAEWEAAVDRAGEAARRVLAHPIHTPEQLAQKLEVLTTEFDDFGANDDDRAPIIADLRRLAGRA